MCAFFLLIKLWGRLHVQITHLQREILNGTNGKEEAIEKETSNARKKERKICWTDKKAGTTIEVDLLIQRLIFHFSYQHKGQARIQKRESGYSVVRSNDRTNTKTHGEKNIEEDVKKTLAHVFNSLRIILSYFRRLNGKRLVFGNLVAITVVCCLLIQSAPPLLKRSLWIVMRTYVLYSSIVLLLHRHHQPHHHHHHPSTPDVIVIILILISFIIINLTGN